MLCQPLWTFWGPSEALGQARSKQKSFRNMATPSSTLAGLRVLVPVLAAAPLARRRTCAGAAPGPQGRQGRPKQLRTWVHSSEPKVGQKLQGVVNTIFPSKALLDVGLDFEATLHVSKVVPACRTIEEVLSPGQSVDVWVTGFRAQSYGVVQEQTWKVDAKLEVSMLAPSGLSSDVTEFLQLPGDALLSAKVTRLEPYGIIAEVRSPSGGSPVQGFVHVSDIREGYVEHPGDEVEVGQDVAVSIVRVDKKFGRLRLTMKLPDVEGY
mmetsp:Transcript_53929/g.101099  ORF Transcript_53929/g.101099 Transcript_53929/m.101099 type:complete len:266 (+) Transcript_53929:30-827(+)